jgi:dihydrofolate synthase/folylpolyglutamate synthase
MVSPLSEEGGGIEPSITNPAEAKAWLTGLYKLGMKLDLDNITALTRRLGNPHMAYPAIHIGGTNGKGSVCQMIARTLEEAGLRVGVYTSPHLVDMNERLTVDGKAIADADILHLTRRLMPMVREVAVETGGHPTFFEVLTAMAFEYFRAAGVDVAVVEVGLGGRLDSTNIVGPATTCITNIGRDHADVLGSDPVTVAWEKAGIVKPGVPVVTGIREEGPLAKVREVCKERGAPLHPVGFDGIRDVEAGNGEMEERFCVAGQQILEGVKPDWVEGQRFSFTGPSHDFADLTLPLAGFHMRENAACALTLLDVVDPAALGIDAADHDTRIVEWARKGLARVRWPARMHLFTDDPVMLVDGSHNAPGVGALALELDPGLDGDRYTVILGIMEDKDWEPMVDPLIAIARRIITVTVGVERSMASEDLRDRVVRRVGELGLSGAVTVASLPDVATALELVAEEEGRGPYLVTGSIFLAGEVLGRTIANGVASPEELGLPARGPSILEPES